MGNYVEQTWGRCKTLFPNSGLVLALPCWMELAPLSSQADGLLSKLFLPFSAFARSFTIFKRELGRCARFLAPRYPRTSGTNYLREGVWGEEGGSRCEATNDRGIVYVPRWISHNELPSVHT